MFASIGAQSSKILLWTREEKRKTGRLQKKAEKQIGRDSEQATPDLRKSKEQKAEPRR
jgi:hypothetical protein